MQLHDMVSIACYNFKGTAAISIVPVLVSVLVYRLVSARINPLFCMQQNTLRILPWRPQKACLKQLNDFEWVKRVILNKNYGFSGLLTWITILCFDQQITTVDELFTIHEVHQDKFHFRWFIENVIWSIGISITIA